MCRVIVIMGKANFGCVKTGRALREFTVAVIPTLLPTSVVFHESPNQIQLDDLEFIHSNDIPMQYADKKCSESTMYISEDGAPAVDHFKSKQNNKCRNAVLIHTYTEVAICCNLTERGGEGKVSLAFNVCSI